MKRLQNYLGMFLVVVASAGLFVACGGEETSCITDEDCGADELCNFETEECAFECEVDGDCLAGEECVEREAEDGGAICVTDPDANNNNDNNNDDTCEDDDDCEGTETCEGGFCAQPCDSADDCEGEEVCEAGFCEDPCTSDDDCGSDFVCDTDTGMCVEDAGDYRFIKVVDDTTVADACSSPDPGSDIMGIELVTDDGSFWADVENADGIDTTDNDLADADSILDGSPPGFDGECPEDGFSEHVFALGCGGDVIVEFHDADGERVYFSAGDSVIVYEYGANCGGSSDDELLVEVCTTVSEDDIFDGTCNGNPLGGGAGRVEVDIVE
ncbi:MAG: hypothetical protein ACLFVJ_14525 [Persicimonas sp.]